MSKDAMVKGYPFEWLESLVADKLNPEQIKSNGVPAKELELAENKLSFEIWKLLNYLKIRTFGRSEKKTKAFVLHFHSILVALNNQAKKNLTDCKDVAIASLNEKVIIGLGNLRQELEHRFAKYLGEPRLRSSGNSGRKTGFKVLCQLSVDQLGILLKAADEMKLILSRSLSLIFRSLVPFLSTEKMKDISWMSMRKSTYQFERADLDTVIALLEKMIKKIKEYY